MDGSHSINPLYALVAHLQWGNKLVVYVAVGGGKTRVVHLESVQIRFREFERIKARDWRRRFVETVTVDVLVRGQDTLVWMPVGDRMVAV
jgi:hypothetical protein